MQEYAQICIQYARNMQQICKDMQRLWISIFYENMQEICTKYAGIRNICIHNLNMQNMQEYALPTLLMRPATGTGPARSLRMLVTEPQARQADSGPRLKGPGGAAAATVTDSYSVPGPESDSESDSDSGRKSRSDPARRIQSRAPWQLSDSDDPSSTWTWGWSSASSLSKLILNTRLRGPTVGPGARARCTMMARKWWVWFFESVFSIFCVSHANFRVERQQPKIGTVVH
jgi:hypothetical protein